MGMGTADLLNKYHHIPQLSTDSITDNMHWPQQTTLTAGRYVKPSAGISGPRIMGLNWTYFCIPMPCHPNTVCESASKCFQLCLIFCSVCCIPCFSCAWDVVALRSSYLHKSSINLHKISTYLHKISVYLHWMCQYKTQLRRRTRLLTRSFT